MKTQGGKESRSSSAGIKSYLNWRTNRHSKHGWATWWSAIGLKTETKSGRCVVACVWVLVLFLAGPRSRLWSRLRLGLILRARICARINDSISTWKCGYTIMKRGLHVLDLYLIRFFWAASTKIVTERWRHHRCPCCRSLFKSCLYNKAGNTVAQSLWLRPWHTEPDKYTRTVACACSDCGILPQT
jgi:hypothetical protein